MLLHYSKTLAISLLATAAVQGVTAQDTSDTSISTFEVDVVFPRSNVTYNLTQDFPIVFAIQNISAALSDKASFAWSIQKWGNVGEAVVPGNDLVDHWTGSFTAGESLPDPYFVINTTNIYRWSASDGPHFPNGSVYSLTWNMEWTTEFSDGASCTNKHNGSSFFNINLNDPNPDLLSLPTCPELGKFFEIETYTKSTPGLESCPNIATPTASANPCAVTVNQAAASSISSVVSSLSVASVAATATTHPTPTSSSAAGATCVVPVRSVLVVISAVVLLRLA
jgi:hypothetical protein